MMTRREFSRATACGATALAAMKLTGNVHAASSERPNVLFLMTDQQRFDAIRFVQDSLACYGGKAKINTPNLDRLLSEGAYFENAYTPCAVCAPARTVLRTGCTIERNGVQSNELAAYTVYNQMAQFREKVNAMESFEQILVEECGYQAAYFGKWHMPERFNFRREYTDKDDGKGGKDDNIFAARTTPEDRVVRYNDVDWETGALCYTSDGSYGPKFMRGLQAYFPRYGKGVTKECSTKRRPGFGPQYLSSYSGYPYDSVAIDSLNTADLPAGSPRPPQFASQPNLVGRDCLDEHLTPSFFTAESALAAIRQFAAESKPFVVTASFHNPHAPMIATGKYFDTYWGNRDRIFVPRSHEDPMEHSDYVNANGRTGLLKSGLRYDQPKAIQEWTVAYYALCEEIDFHIGRLLDELEKHGLENNTMVLFLSDHGEMLGAHGLREKNIFLEESAHVPLFIKLPGQITPGTHIDTPVTLMDVYATILDYCGAAGHERGDGKSLRRHIENTSFNEEYDDEAIVAEWDFRRPTKNGKALERTLAGVPNFLCRKGPWKLMMNKKASSPLLDMLYNLEHDPDEMTNLIYETEKGTWLNEAEMIGKAEYLKALLLDWMLRMDGDGRFYSDPRYNMGEGNGDIAEIRARRKWKAVDFWVSDRSVAIGRPAFVDRRYRKNVWIYFGTTTLGGVRIDSVRLEGGEPSTRLRGFTRGDLNSGEHGKVAVCFDSPTAGLKPVSLSIAYTKDGKKGQARVALA